MQYFVIGPSEWNIAHSPWSDTPDTKIDHPTPRQPPDMSPTTLRNPLINMHESLISMHNYRVCAWVQAMNAGPDRG